ncbi:MAG: hypothetical protein AB7P40_05450 [Chloroflexota bacterium]
MPLILRNSRTLSQSSARSGGRSWRSPLTRSALTAAILFGATTLATPVVAAQTPAPTPATQPAAPPGGVPQAATVDQITDNPDAYYGKAVTIVGDVEDVLGPRAFTVEDQDLLFDEDILVVSATPFAEQPGGALDADMLQSQTMLMSGTVMQFNQADFENRLGISLDDDTVDDWAGRPAMIAQRLTPWSPAIAAPWRNDATNTATAPGPATVESIASRPTAFNGQTVTVGGYVERTFNQQAFILTDGDLLLPERVLVVTPQEAAGLPDTTGTRGLSTDGYIWVSGTVQEFNQADFEQQMGVTLNDSQFGDWAGQPAIIARSVIPVRWGLQRHPPMAMPSPTPDNGQSATMQPSPDAQPTTPGTGSTPADTDISAILEAPDSYIGQTTTVSGTVGQMVGSRAFVLTGGEALDQRMLVIGALSLPGTFAGGEVPTASDQEAVEVTGEIWRLDLSAIEDRIGVDLNDGQFAAWSGQPVMIATAAAPAPAVSEPR